ncbi:hypothetical protein CERZMDRAFT_88093 [Cercospora zeae-maydis SCOH1-5]|uniref:Uncharacterized protein n=1 Tax=Cercospora zeae-maydis SCOH1-5 TaxID=717836 RepID=A0A6A6F455_9PEZI|nr:hypothetical protein CERZMDRAFT_88093 [Cercospora zeae-maydis SCOH1-5]
MHYDVPRALPKDKIVPYTNEGIDRMLQHTREDAENALARFSFIPPEAAEFEVMASLGVSTERFRTFTKERQSELRQRAVSELFHQGGPPHLALLLMQQYADYGALFSNSSDVDCPMAVLDVD